MKNKRPITSLLAIFSIVAFALTSIAPSVAGAANTAEEMLYDDDGDSKTKPVRKFTGSNRYEMAVTTAREFLDKQYVPTNTIVLASGESLVDAAVAVGLAAVNDAPILFTRKSQLPPKVAELIDDYYITDIYIVGGTKAVSEKVLEVLNELPTVSKVVRLAGPTRYATSVAVASEIGDSAGEYCLMAQRTVILTNVDTTFADIVSVGPLSFVFSLPILLTSSDKLPDDIAAYIFKEKVEHVIIVGGIKNITPAVEISLREAGVENIQRIAGNTRYDTAVAISDVIDNCDDKSITLSPSTAALVNGESPADGITAAPLLATGLKNDGITPILLVLKTGDLPEATRAYLADTPMTTSDGEFNNFQIMAMGDIAIMSNATMESAMTAASNREAITATIKATYTGKTVSIKFSEPVDSRTVVGTGTPTVPATSVLNKDNYRFADGTLFNDDTIAYNANTRTVTLIFTNSVGGNKIEVLGNKISGVGSDNRKVPGVTFTVQKPEPDTTRPRVVIFAAENAYEFSIRVEEENIESNMSIGDIQLNNEPLPSTATFPAASQYATARLICLYGTAPAIAVVGDLAPPPNCNTSPSQDKPSTLLAKGDSIKVVSGAVVDIADNKNRTTIKTVVSNKENLRVLTAKLSKPSVFNKGTDENPDLALAKWSWKPIGTTPQISLSIIGKANGAASGAAGNVWRIEFTDAGDNADNNEQADVDIVINDARRAIIVKYDNAPTLGELFDALNNSDILAKNFDVKTILAPAQRRNIDLLESITGYTYNFTGGANQSIITLLFNDVLREFHPSYFVARNIDESLGGNIFSALGLGIFPSSARSEVSHTSSRSSDGLEFSLQFRDKGTEVKMLYVYDSVSLDRDSVFAPPIGDRLVIPRGTAVSYAAHTDENCGAISSDDIPAAGGIIPSGCHDWQTITLR